jgi:hypothetical protein
MAIVLNDVRFWGFGAQILILQEFLAYLLGYPHTYPPSEFAGAANSKAAEYFRLGGFKMKTT